MSEQRADKGLSGERPIITLASPVLGWLGTAAYHNGGMPLPFQGFTVHHKQIESLEHCRSQVNRERPHNFAPEFL